MNDAPRPSCGDEDDTGVAVTDPVAVDRICPECMTEFDYRLDPADDPVFDGDPPVRLCLFVNAGGSVEAVFVHEWPDRD